MYLFFQLKSSSFDTYNEDMLAKFKNFREYPLLVLILLALLIALLNIRWDKFYTGWDNVHPEFVFTQYLGRVFFGAWQEHQSLGAPAAQGHLSEIFRMPIILLLKFLLPLNLVRIFFIFAMYVVGGVGMYFYLRQHWIKEKTGIFRDWLASIGAIFYLLHVLTLQQFYIAFEMFMVQFAYLPFLFIAIHRLNKKMNLKNIFIFLILQLLIAPSAHTQTIFYLATLASLAYAFFISLDKGFIKAFIFSFLVGLLTFVFNAYWIFPNLNYSVLNAHYVRESRDNRMFDPESVWSIREAGSVTNMLKGTHYLFNWRDYSLEKKELQFVFNDWQDHLSNPVVSFFLQLLGVITLVGSIFVFLDKEKGLKRWGILLVYFGCLGLIWIDVFPTKFIVDRLYESPLFLAVFRNTFTKLSIIYSVVSIIVFIQSLEVLIIWFEQKKDIFLKRKLILKLSLIGLVLIMMFTALPSFQGHFISEKLFAKYPEEYWEMFTYLQGRDKNLRVMQLPQLSHAGWEVYDWQFLGKNNGYQGSGFYPFGFPQPYLNRDTDRWIETSDFFYHELKYALDTQNVDYFVNVINKYNVDFVIVDETKIEAGKNHDYKRDHALLMSANMKEVWKQNFLTIYERQAPNTEDEVFAPQQIKFLSADTSRIRIDYPYKQEGNYALTDENSASMLYPFANLTATELKDVTFTDKGVEITRTVPTNTYTLTFPGKVGYYYTTPVHIEYKDNTLKVMFPTHTISAGDKTVELPKITDLQLNVKEQAEKINLTWGNREFELKKDQAIQPILQLPFDEEIDISYVSSNSGSLIAAKPVSVSISPDWDELLTEVRFEANNVEEVTIKSEFPVEKLNLVQNPSVNCQNPKRGTISTLKEISADEVIYKADKYGVNCNGYDPIYMSPAFPYIINFSGQNVQGRGIKVFIHFTDKEVLHEDFLLQQKTFNKFLALNQITNDETMRVHINWENRSFGKEAVNILDNLAVSTFPLNDMAQLKLESNQNSTVSNNAEILSDKIILSVHVVDFKCKQEKCYIALDQSHDKMWLGRQAGTPGFLPHFKYNTWGNLWEVTGTGTAYFFYLPELVALFCFSALAICIVTFLVIFALRYMKKRSGEVPSDHHEETVEVIHEKPIHQTHTVHSTPKHPHVAHHGPKDTHTEDTI